MWPVEKKARGDWELAEDPGGAHPGVPGGPAVRGFTRNHSPLGLNVSSLHPSTFYKTTFFAVLSFWRKGSHFEANLQNCGATPRRLGSMNVHGLRDLFKSWKFSFSLTSVSLWKNHRSPNCKHPLEGRCRHCYY